MVVWRRARRRTSSRLLALLAHTAALLALHQGGRQWQVVVVVVVVVVLVVVLLLLPVLFHTSRCPSSAVELAASTVIVTAPAATPSVSATLEAISSIRQPDLDAISLRAVVSGAAVCM